MGKLAEAEWRIELSFSVSEDCLACLASLHWRRGMIRRQQNRFTDALKELDTSLSYHRQADLDHDLHGNGLAKTLLGRGSVFYEAGLADPTNSASLLSSSVADISESLSLISPTVSFRLYRIAVFNLALALSATGSKEDLLLADRYLRMARRLFQGVTTVSQERAKLDWMTAMIRYELRNMKLHRVLEYLERAQQDFLELGMPQEAIAVTADRARIAFPDQNRIRDLVSEVGQRLGRLSPDLRQRLDDVVAATRIKSWQAPEIIRSALEALRQACGPRTLACLISWPPIT